MSQQNYDVVRGLVLAFSAYYCLVFGTSISQITASSSAALLGAGEYGFVVAESVLFFLFAAMASFGGFVSVTAQSRVWVSIHLIGASLYFVTLLGFEIFMFSQINYGSPVVGIIVGLGVMQMFIALFGCITAGFYLKFVSAASVMRNLNTNLSEPLISGA